MEDLFLIKQIVNGNRDAFRFLVLRYQRPLFRYLSSFQFTPQIVDELAQETFLRMYKHLSEYDLAKGASFSSWMFTIAKNLSLNELARHHRKNEILDADLDKSPTEAMTNDSQIHLQVDQRIDQQLSAERVASALRTLPLLFRTALTLSYFEDLSLEEIASIEGCSVGTVKSRVFRGKRQMRIALLQMEIQA